MEGFLVFLGENDVARDALDVQGYVEGELDRVGGVRRCP